MYCFWTDTFPPEQVRSRGAKAGDGQHYDLGIDSGQSSVVHAEPCVHARAKVLYDNIAVLHHKLQRLDATRILQVNRHAALPAVCSDVHGGHARLGRGTEAAGQVGTRGAFDLDHIGLRKAIFQRRPWKVVALLLAVEQKQLSETSLGE